MMRARIVLPAKRISHYLKVSDSLFWILFLSVITVATRVMLMLLIPGHMYYFDSYHYVSSASDFISGGRVPSVDPPFTLLLGLWIVIFRSISEPLLVARFLNIMLAIITSFGLFSLSRKFLDEQFAFMSTLLIMMEPIFLSFSITTHNDIFALMNAVVSLNWALSQRKIFYVLGVPVTFALAVQSKPFLYIVLGIPIILIYMHRIFRSKKSKRFRLALSLGILIIFSLVPLSPFAQRYYSGITRFDPITKATIFLRLEIIQFIIDRIFLLTNINFIDISFRVLFIVGNIVVFYVLLDRFRRNNKAVNQGTIQFLPSFMLIIAYLCILAFTIFVIPYTIVDGTVIPILDLNRRYLLWPRLAILWVDTFALWKIISTMIKHPEVKT